MNIDRLNAALQEACLRIRAKDLLGSDGWGMYEHHLLRTTRGGHMVVYTVRPRNGATHLKSVLRVLDKRRPYTTLCNGQASRNTAELAFFPEGKGPVIDNGDDAEPAHLSQEYQP